MFTKRWTIAGLICFFCCWSSSARAAEPTLSMTDNINSRFSKPAGQSDDEKPLLAFALEFTQSDGSNERCRARDLSQPRRRPRVDDDAKSADREPTLVESLFAEGYPEGNLREQWDVRTPNDRVYSYSLARTNTSTAPERDPHYVSGPRLVAINGVALRFRDEMPMTFGGFSR